MANSPKEQHLPIRTCVICGNKSSKKELIRIVATPQGHVTLDPRGKAPGRGAYICSNKSCAPASLKRGRLEYALRAKLKDEEWESLFSPVRATSTR